MRIITFNLNGIRSAANKGFFSWLDKQQADVICLQEIRAQKFQLTNEVFNPTGYHAYFVDAQKKGYSGVGIYSKIKPSYIKENFGLEYTDNEGRYLQLDFKNLSIVSIYLPAGISGDERQKIKYNFMSHYLKILKKQRKDGNNYIICGDFNIAHKEIDLKNWKSNQQSTGFLPEERAWLDVIFNELGFVDSFRYKYPNKEQYTWWSQRARAWENNVGWRLDYQILTPELAPKILEAQVYRKEKFSDHAPFIVDYDLEFK